jgi:hypothetical protein
MQLLLCHLNNFIIKIIYGKNAMVNCYFDGLHVFFGYMINALKSVYYYVIELWGGGG